MIQRDEITIFLLPARFLGQGPMFLYGYYYHIRFTDVTIVTNMQNVLH